MVTFRGGYGLDVEAIRGLCEERGWSAWDLARVSGVEHIRRILKGRQRGVNKETAEAIAEALGVPLERVVRAKPQRLTLVMHGVR